VRCGEGDGRCCEGVDDGGIDDDDDGGVDGGDF